MDSVLSNTPRPFTTDPTVLQALERLKFFLATAPTRWNSTPPPPAPFQHPALRRFSLPNGDFVTCVLWGGLYHITGTDIVRSLLLRFEAFGACRCLPRYRRR